MVARRYAASTSRRGNPYASDRRRREAAVNAQADAGAGVITPTGWTLTEATRGGSLAARCAQTRAESYRRLARGPRRPSLASRGRLAELLAWGKRQEKIVDRAPRTAGGSWIMIPPRRRGDQ